MFVNMYGREGLNENISGISNNAYLVEKQEISFKYSLGFGRNFLEFLAQYKTYFKAFRTY